MLPNYRRKKQNKASMIVISFIVIMLVLVVSIKSVELRQKRDYYALREAELSQEIANEEERAIDISEYETYTHTKAYVEEVAREKLGLVYEGEILFRDEN